jgi:hypothetical protein
MNKLPVFKTVGQVFGFVVERRFFTLLRLIWFPALLSVLAGSGPAIYQFQKFGGQEVAPEAVWALFADPIYQGLYALNLVVSFVLSAVIAVCVHRMIFFGDTRPGTYFYLRFTAEEWRYVLAFILYSLAVTIAVALPIGGHFAVLFTQDPELFRRPGPEMMQTIVSDPRTWIAYGLGLLFALTMLTRFGLVFPIIVAEGRLSFARSWELTRGNFWRLIGFWIITVILAILLIMLVGMVFLFAMVAMMGAIALGGETVGALGILVFAAPLVISALVYVVVGVTLFIAALSFSYKALAGDPPPSEVFA